MSSHNNHPIRFQIITILLDYMQGNFKVITGQLLLSGNIPLVKLECRFDTFLVECTTMCTELHYSALSEEECSILLL